MSLTYLHPPPPAAANSFVIGTAVINTHTHLEVAVLELWDRAIGELMDFCIKYTLICIWRERGRTTLPQTIPAPTDEN